MKEVGVSTFYQTMGARRKVKEKKRKAYIPKRGLRAGYDFIQKDKQT